MNPRWIISGKQSPATRFRIFCFPYAGGSAASYRQWVRMSGGAFQFSAVEYPGHGMRMKEEPLSDLATLVRGIVSQIEPELDGDYAFFGHSMGASVVYQLAAELCARGIRGPRHLFVSGSRPPHHSAVDAGFDLSDAGIVRRLAELGATPPELFNYPEFREHLIRVMRADSMALANYDPAGVPMLAVPITAFGGYDDPMVSPEVLQGWQTRTNAAFQVKLYQGNHFFLFDHAEAIFAVMARAMVQAAAVHTGGGR